MCTCGLKFEIYNGNGFLDIETG